MTDRSIPKDLLLELLIARDDDLSRRVRGILADAGISDPVFATQQEAAGTASDLDVKYRLARERGIVVHGLEELVQALSDLGTSLVSGCVLMASSEFALVMMNEQMTRIESLLVVDA